MYFNYLGLHFMNEFIIFTFVIYLTYPIKRYSNLLTGHVTFLLFSSFPLTIIYTQCHTSPPQQESTHTPQLITSRQSFWKPQVMQGLTSYGPYATKYSKQEIGQMTGYPQCSSWFQRKVTCPTVIITDDSLNITCQQNSTVNHIKANLNMEIPEVQAGFRKGSGTSDQIFNLQVFQKTVAANTPIYIAFIDYRKAFDSCQPSTDFTDPTGNGIPTTYCGINTSRIWQYIPTYPNKWFLLLVFRPMFSIMTRLKQMRFHAFHLQMKFKIDTKIKDEL